MMDKILQLIQRNSEEKVFLCLSPQFLFLHRRCAMAVVYERQITVVHFDLHVHRVAVVVSML